MPLQNFSIQSNPSSQINQIFEVSINSKKLISILNRFQENFQKLQKKISLIEDGYKQNDYELTRKLTQTQNSLRCVVRDELQKTKISTKQIMRQYQQRYIKQLCQKQDKIKDIKYSIDTLNDKINKTNINLSTEISNWVKIHSSELFLLKRNFETSQIAFHQQIQKCDQKILLQSQQLEITQQNLLNLGMQMKKSSQKIFKEQDTNLSFSPEKRFQESINTQKYKKDMDGSYNAGFRGRDNLKKHSMVKQNSLSKTKSSGRSEEPVFTANYLTTLEYASISAKIQNLQKKLQENVQAKDNWMVGEFAETANGGFKRSSKSNMTKTFSFTKSFSESHHQTPSSDSQHNLGQLCQKSLVQRFIFRFDQLQSSFSAKQQALRKMIVQLQGHQVTIRQKVEFLKQRQAKIGGQVGEFKSRLCVLQKDKAREVPLQQSSVVFMEDQLGKLIQRMDQEMPRKLDIQAHKLELANIVSQLDRLHENVLFKAQKQDVKKALNFIQDKIKQIILVIAHQFNEETLSAISKVQTRCLTCDRQVLKKDPGPPTLKTPRDLFKNHTSKIVKKQKNMRIRTETHRFTEGDEGNNNFT